MILLAEAMSCSLEVTFSKPRVVLRTNAVVVREIFAWVDILFLNLIFNLKNLKFLIRLFAIESHGAPNANLLSN